jgi:uncharacterized protein
MDGKRYLYIDAEIGENRRRLSPDSLRSLELMIGDYNNIIIDEAQSVDQIGLVLKIMIDSHPGWNIIATGSSSFDLRSKIKEPLTGRAYEYFLEPLTVAEIVNGLGYQDHELMGLYNRIMSLGSYPGVLMLSEGEAEKELDTIVDRYIYKDTLELIELRQQGVLERLMRALAEQIGSEVSYQKLAGLLGVNVVTIRRYITLLENAFIVYSVHALSGSELNKLSNRKRKIYFYDLGVRNMIIGRMVHMDTRSDAGGLWENLCMNEIRNAYPTLMTKIYYWRGVYGEVDMVVEHRGELTAYEFKLGKDARLRLPKEFVSRYPNLTVSLVNPDNLNRIIKKV